jgi:hypothetical protein
VSTEITRSHSVRIAAVSAKSRRVGKFAAREMDQPELVLGEEIALVGGEKLAVDPFRGGEVAALLQVDGLDEGRGDVAHGPRRL